MAQHNELGKKGELLAVNFLTETGYTIMAKNYRYNKAEIDILARKANILAVIEVKTRSSTDFGDPQNFVKPKQIQQLVKATDHYITQNNLDVEVRFDIIAITKQNNSYRITHLEDAFFHF